MSTNGTASLEQARALIEELRAAGVEFRLHDASWGYTGSPNAEQAERMLALREQLHVALVAECSAAPAVHDPVNHPAHYTMGAVEVISAIEAWQLGYHLGNVIKYVARAGRKGDAVQDLRKAKWYLEREIERMERAGAE